MDDSETEPDTGFNADVREDTFFRNPVASNPDPIPIYNQYW